MEDDAPGTPRRVSVRKPAPSPVRITSRAQTYDSADPVRRLAYATPGAHAARVQRERKRQRDVTILKYREEYKTVSTSQGVALTWTTVGAFVPLNLMARGVSDGQHAGRAIRMKRIAGKLGFYGNTLEDFVRWILVYDKAPNGALPTTAQLMEETVGTTFSVPNHDNEWRFKILYDSLIGVSDVQLPQLVDMDIAVDLPTIFNSTATATITAITSGSLFMFGIAPLASINSSYSITVYYCDD